TNPGHTTNIEYLTALALVDQDTHLLGQWCDDMIFVRDRHKVDFVCPAIADEFRASLTLQEDLCCATVLYLTHTGFQKSTPGHSNEWLICKYLHKFFNLEPYNDKDGISIINGKTTFQL